MKFRSIERGVFSEYPMMPYASGMYAGYGWSVSSLLGLAESQGFYPDNGGYGWYYNADTNKSIDLVFAPGGGKRITYYVGDPGYQTVFDKVVRGKSPVSNKEALKAIVEAKGGRETSGRSVGSSTSAGFEQAKKTAADTGAGDPGSPGAPSGAFYQKPWFLPAVAVVTIAGVAAIAFWPAPKKNPKRRS